MLVAKRNLSSFQQATVLESSYFGFLLQISPMTSPTRSIFSPTASRIPNLDTSLNSPRSLSSQTAARLTTNVPETTVVSPRSISNRSELENSIHSLQSERHLFLINLT